MYIMYMHTYACCTLYMYMYFPPPSFFSLLSPFFLSVFLFLFLFPFHFIPPLSSLPPSLSPSPLSLPPFPLRLSILVCVVYSQYWRRFGRLILSCVIVSWLSFLTYYKGKHLEDSRMNLYSPLVIKWRERNELTNSIFIF